MKCAKLDIASWRTPNEYWFVAVCQNCGCVATSITDGGGALRGLFAKHERRDPTTQWMDRVTRALYQAQKFTISERSGNIYEDYKKALVDINRERALVGLEPITDPTLEE
jgi:hypothetical protein